MDELLLTKKIKLWENRLLDLSKRNRMISLKDQGAQVVRFTSPGFEELYRCLVENGREMQIKRPVDRVSEPAVYALTRLMQHLSEPLSVGKGEISTACSLESGVRIIRNIKKYADLSLQEKGTNILYLSFGFLYWKDRDPRSDWLKAPLVLVPASLTQASVNQPYTVRKTEEDIIVNPTFAYYLELNYGLQLPRLEGKGTLEDVLRFLSRVDALVKGLGWRVEQEVYLSTMSFLKTNMYNDLVANEQRLLAHPIIRAFAGEQSRLTMLEESATDLCHDRTNVEQVFEVLNADSSQKDAVELSRRGISFVMQGPPGTGKSQTIANIIAQGVAEGKKILFVSEKQAALEVVYRRLQSVGLAGLCLPLHDPKTSRQTVLKELEANLDKSCTVVSNDRLAQLHRLDGLRQGLNEYATLLHRRLQPLDMSIYEAYQLLFDLAQVEDVSAVLPPVKSLDRAAMNRMIREASEYEALRELLGDGWYTHPWTGIKKRNLSNLGKQRLKEAINTLLQHLKAFRCEVAPGKLLSDVLTLQSRQDYEALGRSMVGLCAVPADMVLEGDCPDPERLPSRLLSEADRLASFYGGSGAQLLTRTEQLQAQTQKLLELFERLSAIVGELGGRVSYLQLFQLQQLLFQHGLEAAELSFTPDYFTPEGIGAIRRLQTLRQEQFSRAAALRDDLCKRYAQSTVDAGQPLSQAQWTAALEQLRPADSDAPNRLLEALEALDIRFDHKPDGQELRAVVLALVDGEFDSLAALSDNEFYFVYDLLEEAERKEQAGDKGWFADFAQLLQRYTGQQADTAEPGTWAAWLARTNDFYYVKTAYPQLLPLARLPEARRQELRRMLEGNTAEPVVARFVEALQRGCLAEDTTPEARYADARQLQAYWELLRVAEESYPEDAAVVGRHYLMASTDWTLIERNLALAAAAAELFGEQTARQLLSAVEGLPQTQLQKALEQLLSAGDLFAAEVLPVSEAVRLLREKASALEAVRQQRLAWREQCQAARELRGKVYKGGWLCFDADVLRCMLEPDSRRLFEILDLLCAMKSADRQLERLLETFEEPQQLQTVTLSVLQSRLEGCLRRFSDYDTMVEFQVCVEHCREDGLNAFLAKAYPLRSRKKTLGKMLEKAFLTGWIDMVTEDAESISAFSARVQGNRISDFCRLDQTQLDIAQERVLALAHDRMPGRNTGKVVGEMGILLREISKSRNAMSIRQLFDSIPELLTKLKPCMMMSPLSVAYFLKADRHEFDMVIFDEASQIFPENAISAILRGRQVIIAGDSKQMPPTSFFRTAVGAQEEDEEDELAQCGDSILEEAENVLPNLSLTWHYRSRNESLITFSNQNMYAGSLVTFPNNAPNKADSGVEYVHVDSGVYEDRRNEAEAQACVALTIRHFQQHPDRSIGIIAFSINQEECIEQAFEVYRSRHPEYEHFFREDREDPFFIKNLENVQGDERDTILLSVGYGRNRQGQFRYNFGPLGKQGGERRMNVAITRAKHNIKLVTSLRPEDFDRSRLDTNAGARLLYDYIRYAQSGAARGSWQNTALSDDGFKRYLVEVLRQAGYQTALGVGNSGYKVELAVVDPRDPQSYIVGIETDGGEYARVRTARDRERLRPHMLSTMGWNMYRAWSTQWIRDPETEKKKLLDFVAQCLRS